eukprot:TRINITY_DN67665_c0_g1_i1.p1 TRINITY_DN67665_c0_g1~~TRINITY_DN67665_c0_g1_i1.p1  ORF type:complete len:207 (-),score=26.32 TRINITY_DN67665_c0_g1_i1:35-655(-)
MGMCAVTVCCPPMCAGASIASSILVCCLPRIAILPIWIAVAAVALMIGLGVYLDLTFKCQAVSAPRLGNEPVPGTGVWINVSDQDAMRYAESIWYPPSGTRDGEVLVNATIKDLGWGTPPPWSPSPLAYQSAPCWSEGSGAYLVQGMAASFFMSVGAAGLLISLVTFVLKRTSGTCCGRPFEKQETQASSMQAPVAMGAPLANEAA